ncbi:MAG: hypothetical protein JXR88_14350 [Clostridia bacterium]|nr:hypothetical protein [Clostridia bacterium]
MYRFLGLLFWIYAIAVFYIAIAKPTKIWEMKKIQIFRKLFKEKGTVIFFIIWALVFVGLGIWLFTL